jgi:hypothetical protein
MMNPDLLVVSGIPPMFIPARRRLLLDSLYIMLNPLDFHAVRLYRVMKPYQ